MKSNRLVPVFFLMLSAFSFYYSGMGASFVLNEVLIRFIRDGVLVLALLVPIAAGMGINFAVTIGAISAQIGLLIVIIIQKPGLNGFFLAVFISVLIAVGLGYLIGIALNRVKGWEMIATFIIGFLAHGIYQFIFLAGYGTVIKPINKEILLSIGIGIRNMVDLAPYRNLMDEICKVQIGSIELPLFMILLVLCFCAAMAYLMNTRLGQHFKVVGADRHKAEALGFNVDRIRIQAMIISTVMACLGQLIFLQNMGMLNVYTAHKNSDIFSAAALLAGGATIKEARVRNVLLGIFLFHSLFIVSPQAGQNLFGNAALGEYFRSFIAYGTIAVALIFNYSDSDASKNQP